MVVGDGAALSPAAAHATPSRFAASRAFAITSSPSGAVGTPRFEQDPAGDDRRVDDRAGRRVDEVRREGAERRARASRVARAGSRPAPRPRAAVAPSSGAGAPVATASASAAVIAGGVAGARASARARSA